MWRSMVLVADRVSGGGRLDGGPAGVNDQRVRKQMLLGEIVLKPNGRAVSERTICRCGLVEIQEEPVSIIGRGRLDSRSQPFERLKHLVFGQLQLSSLRGDLALDRDVDPGGGMSD